MHHDILEQVILTLMLVSMMLSMGLRMTIQDFWGILRDLRLVSVTLVVNFVVLPLMAFLVVYFVGLEHEVAAGILLCAAAPGATMSTILAREAHGDVPVAVVLLLVLVIVSAFITPLIATELFRWAQLSSVRMRAGMAILSLLLIQILPLAVGMIVRAMRQHWAEFLEPYAARFASIVLGVVIVGECAFNYKLVLSIGGISTLVIAVLVLLGAGIGWCFPGTSDARASTSLVTGAQNIALAMLLAGRYLGHTGLMTVLIFGMMTYVVLIPLVIVFRKTLPSPT